jgi:beta-fructofuranosidase
VYVNGTYHLFMQYVPEAVEWKSNLCWGHATSKDLLHSTELRPALDPMVDEVGCWSGSVVIDDAGVPHLFYTRPSHDEWGRGMVVLARGNADLSQWTRTGVVIDGPSAADYFDFRDPQVRRDGDGWKMTIGAGKRGIGGCALQYHSQDLEHWEFDGELASRPASHDTPFSTGTVWECPQFLQIDGAWVLLVSAMVLPSEGDWAEVVYAVGDYDGLRFTPRTWGRFGHSKRVYATTTFRDVEGAPCAMSWLRDTYEPGQQWAGEQSFVHRLNLVDDRLVVSQHPNLDPIVAVEDPAWRATIEIADARSGGFCVDVDDEDTGWSLVLDWDASLLHVTVEDAVVYAADLRHDVGSGTLDIVVAAGIAEITWSGGEGLYVALVPDLDPKSIDVTNW